MGKSPKSWGEKIREMMVANMLQNETVGRDPGPNQLAQQIRGHDLHESIHKGQGSQPRDLRGEFQWPQGMKGWPSWLTGVELAQYCPS